MAVINRFADWHDETVGWRRDLHRNPELLYDLHRTAAFVAGKLREFGCDEVVEGLGRTGVVGVIRGRAASGPAIGFRADMDALPIDEESGKPWASETPGRMHACGHDGHTTMLLAAARHLAETRNFAGTAVMIFQPAEEGGAGADAMIKDGLFDRFEMAEVYGMHNAPGLAVGHFAIRPGPLLASASKFQIVIEGKGGHAAKPHSTVDPIAAGAQIVSALQTVVARNVDPLKSAVLSITVFKAGEAFNIIPQRALLMGTIRALETGVNDMMERRMAEVVGSVAAALGTTATIEYAENPYPVTVNHAAQTEKATAAACDIAGSDNVDTEAVPMMAAEDFSFMLNVRPGAFIFLGNGDTAGLHHPAYDFTDAAIPFGASYWSRLAERLMPAG